MAIDANIVNFGQSTPVANALSGLGGSVAGAIQANKQSGLAENRKLAAGYLAQAFDDSSDEAATKALIAKAQELDPEFTLATMQQVRKSSPNQSKQQVKTEGLEGYVFDPATGSLSIDPNVSKMLSDKAGLAASSGVELDVKDKQGINKDVTALLKATSGIVGSAKSLEGLKKSSSSAAKLAAVFSFMKAMDPSSTVRESEQGQVYDAEGAAKGIANKVNALMGEGGLSAEGFQDLVNTANNLANTAIDSSSSEIGGYLDAYEESIPQGFKDRLIGRVPARLGIDQADSKAIEKVKDDAYSDSVRKYMGSN